MFWDFPTLDQLHNVRLYRAPIPEEDPQNCSGTPYVECYTQDITGTVYAIGDSGSGDPGVGGKSKGFSDYEVVDLTSSNSPAARIWIGLKKDNDAGILFDLKAVVKKNGAEVSSGELLGAPGGGKGFNNANLLTIPLSFPTEAFCPGDNVSIKLFVRNSCLIAPRTPAPRDSGTTTPPPTADSTSRVPRPSIWCEATTTESGSATTTATIRPI